jgi:hypothetical protein
MIIIASNAIEVMRLRALNLQGCPALALLGL